MNRLPHHERAVIPENKLRYSLDFGHPSGHHKARVFRSAFGLEAEDWPVLGRMLRDGIAANEGVPRSEGPDGTQRWVVEWVVVGRLGRIRMVSAWEYHPSTGRPRLLSCYLKKVKR